MWLSGYEFDLKFGICSRFGIWICRLPSAADLSQKPRKTPAETRAIAKTFEKTPKIWRTCKNPRETREDLRRCAVLSRQIANSGATVKGRGFHENGQSRQFGDRNGPGFTVECLYVLVFASCWNESAEAILPTSAPPVPAGDLKPRVRR
jgi:hypothetical protein